MTDDGLPRRYLFKLYPNSVQAAALHEQARLCAELWNALLSMYEARSGERQRQTWFDAAGERHRGVSCHVERPWSLTRFTFDYWVSELLAECPEWRALSTWTPRRVAGSLHKAIAAFYCRARKGAGAQSGYPRYRATRRADAVPHRFASGCRLEAVTARSWHLRLKGVPGSIRARGRFPARPLAYTDADVMWRDGAWWLSVCTQMPTRRTAGDEDVSVAFDLIDTFARVFPDDVGANAIDAELRRADDLCRAADAVKSERDTRYRGRNGATPPSRAWLRETRRAGKLTAKATRIRREALHQWTTSVVQAAGDLTVTAPPIQAHTVSPRGDAQAWGASVETVSRINRAVLAQSPAAAVRMLSYKAEEAEIRCDLIEDRAPAIAVGEKLVAAGKAIRKSKRAMMRQAG